MEYQPGDRVEINVSEGIVPGTHPRADWQPGAVLERLPNGHYRVVLDEPIGGRRAEKETAPEHLRRLDR